MNRRAYLSLLGASTLGGSALSSTVRSRSANSSSKELVDVYLVAGQSNAEGMGSADDSPDIDEGVGYEFDGGKLVHLDDPVGSANSGSAWPTFVLKYHKNTGRRVVIVPLAEGSTHQYGPAADKNIHWDEGGSLRKQAVQKLHNCLDLLPKTGFAPVFRGILWNQGEADAFSIHNGEMTPADYESALRRMVDTFQADIRVNDWEMFIFETAQLLSKDGYGTVSERQFQVAAERPHCHIVFDEGERYQSEGWADWIHYRQVGYNKMGMSAAKSVDQIISRQ